MADEADHSDAADERGTVRDAEGVRIRLARGGSLRLGPEGFRLVAPRGFRRSPIVPWPDLTHVVATDRSLVIGTRRGIHGLRARDLVEPGATPRTVRQAMLEGLARHPDGAAVLERMAAIDRLQARDVPSWTIWITIFACLAGTALQLANPLFEQVGSFLPDLFARGEWWRALTCHFMHDLSVAPEWLRPFFFGLPVVPVHLAMNVGGLVVLGHLVERPLGAHRTAIVMAVSALGTVAGIIASGHLNVLGASGLVAGLAGALLALELHHARELPSPWRLPRGLFVATILFQFAIIDRAFAEVLAGGAHLGGFAGGYVAAWLLGRGGLVTATPPLGLRLAASCAAALLVVGFLGAMPLARRDMAALERHALRLYDTPAATYLFRHDNAAAWLIATEGGASPAGLELAVALADRAAHNTGRMLPGILDTLAEALFQRGDALAAVLVIEEAIRLDPREPYYREQRRRFLGERARDDRPPPPGSEPPLGPADELPFDRESPRLTI